MNTMEATKTIKLIAGEYSPEEAREILYSLLSSKIEFHFKKDFSSQDRFGKPNLDSRKRMEELRHAKEEMLVLMKAALAENKRIKISSQVIISIEN